MISKPTIDIIIDEIPGRKKLEIKEKSGEGVKLATFRDRENITGKVIINLNKIKKFEHKGIKIELIGMIENLHDKKNVSKFINLTKDLEPPAFITTEITNINFSFTNVEKQYETFRGNNMQVRYLLRVTIETGMRTQVHDQEFGVVNPHSMDVLTEGIEPIKLEVGIEDWLHLIFEVDKFKYHQKDCVTGQVVFKKVSIRLKSMELQIIRRETMGAGILFILTI